MNSTPNSLYYFFNCSVILKIIQNEMFFKITVRLKLYKIQEIRVVFNYVFVLESMESLPVMKHDGISTLKILFIFSFPSCQFLLIIFIVSRFTTLTSFGNHNYYWSCWNLIMYWNNSVLTTTPFVSWILYFDFSLYWLNFIYKYFLPECLIAPVFSEFMTTWKCLCVAITFLQMKAWLYATDQSWYQMFYVHYFT